MASYIAIHRRTDGNFSVKSNISREGAEDLTRYTFSGLNLDIKRNFQRNEIPSIPQIILTKNLGEVVQYSLKTNIQFNNLGVLINNGLEELSSGRRFEQQENIPEEREMTY